ncbi:hypothetical protein C9374_005443 [Naegleria lovaniensis]|uniref:Uncharacterized protein n=1 Tax=Naegleria lovaniensis TaxID=51637 RepID=A0AA88GN40_NAELO|nr:uncharacterized protein C9374_005443 [Naegleria lovaniensis]KAG2382241.1 hypothetical protein C9374_005443 [Naegleria lovaniensis]
MQKQAFSFKTAKFQSINAESGTTQQKRDLQMSKESLKARSKYDLLKNSVEKLLNARSQNKQNIEAKSKLLQKSQTSLKAVEDLVSDLSKTKVKWEAVSQSEIARLAKLKSKCDSLDQELQGVKGLLSEVEEKSIMMKEAVEGLRQRISGDQQRYEEYVDQAQLLQNENQNQEVHLAKVMAQHNEREKKRFELENEIKEKQEVLQTVLANVKETIERTRQRRSQITLEQEKVSRLSELINSCSGQLEELTMTERKSVSTVESLENCIESVRMQRKQIENDIGDLEREINDFRQHKDGYEAFRFKDAIEKFKIKAGDDINNELDTTKISSLAQKLQMKEKYLKELKEALTELCCERESLDKAHKELEEVRTTCLRDMEQMTSDIEEHVQLRNQLNQRLEDERQQSKLVRAEIEEYHHTLQKLNSEIYSLELESEQSLDKEKQIIEELNLQLEKAANEERKLSEMISKEELTIATIRQECERKQEEKKAQEQLVKSDEIKLATLREDNNNLQTYVNNLEKEILEMQNAERNIKDTINEKQSMMQKLSQEVGLMEDFDLHQSIEELKLQALKEIENYQQEVSKKYQDVYEKEKQTLFNKKEEVASRLQTLQQQYQKSIEELDSTIQSLSEKLQSGNVEDIKVAEKRKSEPRVVPEPIFSIDFDNDLFTDNESTKEKNFDFFDEDY